MLPAPLPQLRAEWRRMKPKARVCAVETVRARLVKLDEPKTQSVHNGFFVQNTRGIDATPLQDYTALDCLPKSLRVIINYSPFPIYSGEVLNIYRRMACRERETFDLVFNAICGKIPSFRYNCRYDVPPDGER